MRQLKYLNKDEYSIYNSFKKELRNCKNKHDLEFIEIKMNDLLERAHERYHKEHGKIK